MNAFIIRTAVSLIIVSFFFISAYFYKKAKKFKLKNVEDESNIIKLKNYKKISLIFFIIYIILFLCRIIYSAFQINSSYFDKSYYDLYHNEYKSIEDVVYYSSSGERYTQIKDEYYFAKVEDSKERIDAGTCYIDEAGYFVILDSYKINYDETVPINNPYCFYDSDGNLYATASLSYWNENGDLVIYGQESDDNMNWDSFQKLID